MENAGELFATLFAQYPWLVAIGPVQGVLLAFVKRAGQLAGFGLLLAGILTSLLVIAAYGYAQGWAPTEWRQVPFALFLSVAASNLVGSSAETLIEHVNGER